ncbi:uncharacterized protein [Aegilops tauschii subsp. strangulata]|uniref:uncharacterized protein n=1 Tax=Aegilops tauschii subsp. strangulata TaxID=200361 RepID=UPI003CC8D79D
MVADAEWTAIDATIIRWFFTTISKDLFHTVVSAGDDARALWVKLNGLFTDNQVQRRVFLQQEFFDCHQDEQSIDDYCRRLKTLADELRDIGAKVDDDLLLSMLTAGLNEDFGNAASNLTLMPEPSFPKFVAYLRLEERRMKGVKKRVQHHALAAGTSRGAPPSTAPPTPRQQQPPPAPPGYFPLPPAPPALPAAPSNRVAGAAATAAGAAALFAASNAAPYSGYGTAPPPAPAYGSAPAYGAAAAPAYGTAPSYGAATATAFGAAPTPAYGGFYPPQASPPWDPALLAALHSAPSPSSYGGGGDWYMDSGATAHMTAHPVTNLVSVRRLTRENPITVEFDDIGFSVKDARTRMVLHRCDSPDELYPVHPSGATTTRRPTAFAASLLHSDVWTSPVASSTGYLYYLVILDDFTHYVWTFPLRRKSDALATLTAFYSYVTTQLGRPILALQTDNGKEFDNVAVRNLLASHGTIFRLTCPYTSQQNGRAERVLRTLNDCVRTLLFHSYVPTRFWPDALATANLLINIRPCRSRWNYTPHQLLFGAVPSYDGLRIFGCLCYPSTASTAPHKLAPRSLPCIFLGYPPNTKGYRCYDPVSHRVFTSRHVYFDELVFPFQQVPSPSESPAARFAPSSTFGGPPSRAPGPALPALPATAAPAAAHHAAASSAAPAGPRRPGPLGRPRRGPRRGPRAGGP